MRVQAAGSTTVATAAPLTLWLASCRERQPHGVGAAQPLAGGMTMQYASSPPGATRPVMPLSVTTETPSHRHFRLSLSPHPLSQLPPVGAYTASRYALSTEEIEQAQALAARVSWNSFLV